jgi:hypothetical protein
MKLSGFFISCASAPASWPSYEPLQPVKFGLALARARNWSTISLKLRVAVDFVAPCAWAPVPGRGRRYYSRDRVDRLNGGRPARMRKPADRENRQRHRQQVDAMLLQRPREIGESATTWTYRVDGPRPRPG